MAMCYFQVSGQAAAECQLQGNNGGREAHLSTFHEVPQRLLVGCYGKQKPGLGRCLERPVKVLFAPAKAPLRYSD